MTPLFWYTRPELGGYGFSPLQISAFLAGIGISQACWLLIAFPILQKKYGTGGVLRACYLIWPIFFFVCPFCNFLLRKGHTTAFWIIAPTFQVSDSRARGFSQKQIGLPVHLHCALSSTLFQGYADLKQFAGTGVSMAFSEDFTSQSYPSSSPTDNILIIRSLRPTRPERHLPLAHQSRYTQRSSTHSRECRPNRRTSSIYCYLCGWCSLSISERISDLGRVYAYCCGGDCGDEVLSGTG